jgi:prepilin-type N-terminal cleavage/methylation domain-containing protein
MNRNDCQQERGFSLIEALVALVILTVIILMLYELMIGSMRATMFVESRNDLEIFAQRTVNSIQTALLQSRIIHQEIDLGQKYRGLMVASDLSWAIYPNSRLPLADPGEPGCDPPLCDPPEPPIPAILDPDESAEHFVGNELLLVRALEPVPVLYDHDNDNDAVTQDIPFYVDRYRLEFYFLTLNTARNFNGSGSYLDLIKATSPDFADYFQLNTTLPSLTLQQRQDIASGLANLPAGLTTEQRLRMEIDGPITQAWDPSVDPTLAPATYAFFDIDDDGGLNGVVVNNFDVKKGSVLPEFAGGRIGGKMEYSVATNSDTPLGDGRFGPLRIMNQVPLFGLKSSTFPGGFEIKMIGPTGARSIWNRLVLCSENVRIQTGGPGREVESEESVVISSAREY